MFLEIILGIAGLAILEAIDRKTNGKITRIRRKRRRKR
jgi:hypothetical protein